MSGSDYDDMLSYGREWERIFLNFNFIKKYILKKLQEILLLNKSDC